MPTRERLRSIGQRQGDYLTRRLGQEAREQRLAAGLSQVRLSSLIGVSRQWLADFEMGRLRVVDMRKVALVFAFLGHKLVANAYPAGDGFRDSGQLKLLGRLNGRLSSIWIRESEKAMSIAGDLRAWDEVLRGPDDDRRRGRDAPLGSPADPAKHAYQAARQRGRADPSAHRGHRSEPRAREAAHRRAAPDVSAGHPIDPRGAVGRSRSRWQRARPPLSLPRQWLMGRCLRGTA